MLTDCKQYCRSELLDNTGLRLPSLKTLAFIAKNNRNKKTNMTGEYPESQLKDDQKADKIIINKAKHELLLYNKEALIANYKVSLGRNGLNKKQRKAIG